ncbi:CHASE2 domain-containing serine/threonine-protein kinase [Halofilum ochraceum]|uniref:CHASE2 domain-containing serine/threonine-protein kinase n=1 Tax=Halofilum ochraceum TaxID=1611323 RepID=UPI0008D95D3E|nr:serine/threonine-protein kinase [Halofilum ochraceum]
MKAGFLKSDWFVGVVVSLVFVAASGTALLQSLERSLYDWGVTGADAEPSDRIAVIAIDDESIANLGRWPWSRDLHGRMIGKLAEGGADAIGYTVFFLEPQIDPGLTRIRELLEYYDQRSIGQLPAIIEDPDVSQQARERLDGLHERLASAATDLDTDQKLAQAMEAADNVVLGMPFRLGSPVGKPDNPLPEYVRANTITNVAAAAGPLPRYLGLPAQRALSPIEPVGPAADAIGHLNFNPDIDGGVRSQPLVIDYFDDYYPSLSLMVAARGLNLNAEDITIRPGRGVQLGGLDIATDSALQMNMFFYDDEEGAGTQSAFPVDSFYDVLSGRIPAEKYENRIVLVGATATGVGDAQVTPISATTAPVITLAHAVSSILEQDFFLRPDWAHWARMGAFALIALYLIVLVPRLRGGTAAVIGIILVGGAAGTGYGLLVTQQMWIPLATPAALLVVGYTLMMTKRFLATERGKLRSDAESAESNRMLGLSFQSQGQLDTAFEKYRKCPLDDSMMEVLYNLALDYERKRQFNKASNVYDYMAKHDGDFRDIATRRKRAKKMEETVVLGGGGGGGDGTMVLGGDDIENPKLGRYDVEKEIGKGAMGTVYQGRDPKINRVVAIKTLALSQEFEADELEDVKERFFREAETAGRLNHPNIVTIYDAGEEHDLAYISMEYLKGKDLTPWIKAGNLLPLRRVLEMVADCAEALAYAHDHNVVHRDVKPGNIMYDPDSQTLKITDFGIARITDSSRTKTGMVLGTPSYMSPEQLAGNKVDGRSDLFSLGVMLYQMVTGKLPFTADSMATLMYRIANEPHTPIHDIDDQLPDCVGEIVDRAMEKDPDTRYADGRSMAAELRACAERIDKG